MSLETEIKTAYEEKEVVENAARDLEARIRKIEGAERLMPVRSCVHSPAIPGRIARRFAVIRWDRADDSPRTARSPAQH